MIPQSILIQQPAVDLATLVGACSQIFDHNVAEGIDKDRRKLHPAEKLLSVLDAMRHPGIPVGLPTDLLEHVSFSVLTVAAFDDMLDILGVCSGMQTVVTVTKEQGILVAMLTGTLRQWRDAVAQGCHEVQHPTIRAGFNQIYSLFVGHSLGGVWKNFRQKPTDHNTFLLEQ